jgi:hypothetical protein
MTLSKRERQISVVVLVAAALLVLDQLALTPYLERRRALVDEAGARADELADVTRVMKKEQRLRRALMEMGSAMAGGTGGRQADPSQAEGRFLTLLDEWEKQAGVAKASFQRLRSVEAYGFTRLTFQVSATGRMPAIAALMYHVETAPIPLHVDQMQVMLSGASGDELQVQFTVSALCRTSPGGGGGPRPESPQRRGGVALLEAGGGGRR